MGTIITLVVLGIAGWTRAGRHYALAADASRPAPMNLVEPGKFDAPPGLSFLQCGSIRLMLAKAENDAGGTSTLYFLVSDIEHAAQRLTARGATVQPPHLIAKMPDHELWLAEFKDSEGNLMALMEEKRRPAEPQLQSIG